jgi:hypothetical protein
VGQKRQLDRDAECVGEASSSSRTDATQGTCPKYECTVSMELFYVFLQRLSPVSQGDRAGQNSRDAQNGLVCRKVLLHADTGFEFCGQECLRSVQGLAHAMANDLASQFPSCADVQMFSLLEPSMWAKSSKVSEDHKRILKQLID